MDYKQCSLLYQIADKIARRVQWLATNGRAEDAARISNGIISGWQTVLNNDNIAYSEAEVRHCTPKKSKSVIKRIASGLDLS
jgi:hypothetical protein